MNRRKISEEEKWRIVGNQKEKNTWKVIRRKKKKMKERLKIKKVKKKFIMTGRNKNK